MTASGATPPHGDDDRTDGFCQSGGRNGPAQDYYDDGSGTWTNEPPDPLTTPGLFSGVLTKRVIGYLLDVIFLTIVIGGLSLASGILSFFTFGLAGAILYPLLTLIPLLYHTILIASPRHSTFGMGMMGLEVRSTAGGSPTVLQALIMTVVFYLSLSFILLLLVPLFTRRRQTVHDLLSSTLVVNRTA